MSNWKNTTPTGKQIQNFQAKNQTAQTKLQAAKNVLNNPSAPRDDKDVAKLNKQFRQHEINQNNKKLGALQKQMPKASTKPMNMGMHRTQTPGR